LAAEDHHGRAGVSLMSIRGEMGGSREERLEVLTALAQGLGSSNHDRC